MHELKNRLCPFSGPCYLARCDLITDRVWICVKCEQYA